MLKIVFATIVSTCAAISLLASIFLNSILGTFGLVSTTISHLDSLKSSHEVVSKMKKRHKKKKAGLSKRFVKKAGRKASSLAAASAVTVPVAATAAVVITATGLEVVDYCDYQRELHEDEQILFGIAEPFDYNDCMTAARQDADEVINAVQAQSAEQASKAWADSKSYASELWQSLLDWSQRISGSAAGADSEYWRP